MNESLNQILTRLENEWLPAALELGIRITFWNSVGNILIGLICLVFVLTAPAMLHRLYRTFEMQEKRQYKKESADFDDWDDWRQFICILMSVLGIVTGIISFICVLHNFFDIWNWIGIFDPQLRLAYDIYNAALKASK